MGANTRRQPFLFDVGAAEGIGHEHPRRRFRRPADEVQELRVNAKLRDGERPELHFEGDEPFHRRVDGFRHGPGPFVGFDGRGDPAKNTEQEGSRADGRIGNGDGRRSEAGGLLEAAAQNVVDEPDHRPDDFGRGVIRAGQLSQVVVVDLQKILVEVEPRIGIALADRLPVDGVENPRERAERRLQGLLIVRVVGQEPQGGADQRVRLPELLGGLIETGAQLDFPRAGHEQTERHGLRIAIGELGVVGLGEEQLPPVGGQRREGRALQVQLFGDLVAEQSTEAGGDLCQFLRGCRRDRLPRKKLSNRASSSGGA